MKALIGFLFFSNLFFKITDQPSGRDMIEGDAYTLKVNVNRICKIQWYKNGKAIPGATNNTLEIKYALEGHSGTYHAVATRGSSEYRQSSKATIKVDKLVRVLVNNDETTGVVQMSKPMTVRIIPYEKSAKVYYTLDGSEPSEKSQIYNAPFQVKKSGYLRMYINRLEADSILFWSTTSDLYKN